MKSPRLPALLCALMLALVLTPLLAGAAITTEYPDWTCETAFPASNSSPVGPVSAVARDASTGDFFVAQDNRVMRLSSAGAVEASWSMYGGATLKAVDDVAFDGTYVYAVQTTGTPGYVYRFTPEGAPAGMHCASDLMAPAGITYKDGVLLVADSWLDRVVRLDTADLSADVPMVMGEGFLTDPIDVAFDANSTNVWVTQSSANGLAKFTSAFNGASPALYSGPWAEVGGLTSPKGIAADGSWVYVTDAGNRVVKVSQTTPAWAESFLATGENLGQVRSPGRLDYDAALGAVLIADEGNSRVQTARTDGSAYGSVGGGAGSDAGAFFQPNRVTLDASGTVYVLDTGNSRIQVFSADSTGTPTAIIGSFGTGEGQFAFPQGLDLDSNGGIYVSDTGNSRVQHIAAGGSPVTTVCSSGTAAGSVLTPGPIALMADGSLWIADNGNHRLQHISSTGTVLESSSSLIAFPIKDLAIGPRGQLYAVHCAPWVLEKWNGRIRQIGAWQGVPSGVDVDAAGNIWVSNASGIWSITLDGSYLAGYVASGTAFGEFSGLSDIAVDDTWQAWTTDNKLHRVQRFRVADETPPYTGLESLSGGRLDAWYRTADVTAYLRAYDVRIDNRHSNIRSVHAVIDGAELQLVWDASGSGIGTGAAMYPEFYEYRMATASRYTYSSEGTHSITSWAQDGAGNTSEPTTTVFGIDRTGPSIVVSGYPQVNGFGWTNQPFTLSISMEDTLSGVSGQRVVVGTGYGNPGTYTFDTSGRYSFSAIASDVAGNWSNWTGGNADLDLEEPTITVTISDTESGSRILGADPDDGDIPGSSGIATISATVDGERIGNGYWVELSTVGTHTVTFTATDCAGNSATWGPTDIGVDDTPSGGGEGEPVVEGFWVARGETWWNSATMPIHSGVSDATEMRFSANSGITWTGWMPWSAEATVTLPNPPGDGTWTVSAQYRNGGALQSSASDGVSVDRIAPATSCNASDQAVWWGSADLSFVVNDAGSGSGGTYYRLDDGPTQSGMGLSISTVGTHTLEWWSVDCADNEELPHRSAQVRVSQKEECSLSLASSTATATYPSPVTFSATLTAQGSPVADKILRLERSSSAAGPWSLAADFTYTTDCYVATSSPSANMYYRAVFAEDETHLATETAALLVRVRPAFSTPKTPSRIYLKRAFTTYSYIRPKHSSGVKFKYYRYVSGSYRYYKSVSAKYSSYNSTTSKIYCSTSLPYRGRWKVIAYHSDSGHVSTSSSAKYFTIR